MNSLLNNEYPVLVVGPVGTGKTSVLQSVFNCLDKETYSAVTLNMSAQTTSKNVQVSGGNFSFFFLLVNSVCRNCMDFRI